VVSLAVHNGLVMSHYIQRRTAVTAESAIGEAVTQEAQERATPVVTTALAVAAALLPLLIVGNVPGTELVRSMIIVILGGLVTSTFFTLFVLPAAFILWPATSVSTAAPAMAQPALETV
jgi:Cu/Ag efflux pump CusA